MFANWLYAHRLVLFNLMYLHDFDIIYSKIDYTNKTVVDIGCDFGTTPLIFRLKGAKHVYGYTKGKNNLLIQSLTREKWFTLMGEFNEDAKRKMPYADVLKADCEGCEALLTPDIISRFPEWIIAIHDLDSAYTLPMADMLVELGGRFIYRAKGETVYSFSR